MSNQTLELLNWIKDTQTKMVENGCVFQEDKPRLKSAKARVRHLMLDHKWHTANEICEPSLGGREGLRRLRELRKDGWIVDKRRLNGGTFEYRMWREYGG